ncbi:TPA: transporter [Pseudomonas aeruginosa]|uniref:transporter n=1 Tax=Pseudomonas aeruginosa TaxID=287 RepID=UPI000ACFB6BD|nr:transporter [Pseudomonas aeruginosa]
MPLAKLSLPTLALCVGLLGACSPTPRQPRAAPIVPANGPDLRGKLDDWQQQFTDPLLRQMIDDRLRAGAIRRASLNSAVLFPP